MRVIGIGDVVVLNSGGPAMTVVAFEGDNVCCAWIDDANNLEQAWFPTDCVHLMNQPAKVGVG